MLKIHQQFILSDIPVISSQTFLSTLITVFQLNFNRISAYRTFNPHCSLCFKTNIKQSSISTAGTMHFQKCFLYFCFSTHTITPYSNICSYNISCIAPIFKCLVKCIFKFYLAEVNSIPVEFTSAWIFPSSFYKILLQMIPCLCRRRIK